MEPPLGAKLHRAEPLLCPAAGTRNLLLNNGKWTAMDFEKRETLSWETPQRDGCPWWGSSRPWCGVSRLCQTPGHSPPRAAASSTHWDSREGGRQGGTTLGNGILLLLTITFMHSSCSPAELCLLCAAQLPPGKDKVVTHPSYPEGTKVVSTIIFKSAFKHLSRSHLAKWMPDLHLRRQGRKSSQGCLGEWQSLNIHS